MEIPTEGRYRQAGSRLAVRRTAALKSLLAAGALVFGAAPLTASAQSHDQAVTPDFFAGAGNSNEAFTLAQQNGIELALRGKLRFDAGCQAQNTFNSNHDGTFSFDAVDVSSYGCTPGWADGDTPEWSFDWSINSNFDGSTAKNLDQLTYELGMDADPTLTGTDFLVFDPINLQFADHAIGDNTTTDGFNEFTAAGASGYASLISMYNVAQQTWSYEFFDNGTPLDSFKADIPGFYDIYLKAFEEGTEVASVAIQVIVGGGCSVAPNPVAVNASYTLATGGAEEERTAPADAGIYAPGDEGYDVPAACGNLVVYDPAGGFVTGGGWITSPEGAMGVRKLVWDQDFSVDDSGWFDEDNGWSGAITVAGGEANIEGGPYSHFDGYRATWPGKWIAEIDVYLDPDWPAGQGFDYSVASTGTDGAHQRDFIFHVTRDTSTGKLLVGGSNNTNFVPREDLDTINHYEVPSAGWYTLQHVFYDNGGSLAVDLNLLDSLGNVLFTETRTTAADTIPGEVGGNRYAWFTALNVADGLRVDNHQLFLEQAPSPEGRANFGFVSRYKKGANVPTGSTEFVFKTGALNFHSNVQDWLVVTGGDNAKFKGIGSINGEGEYKFMIWAGDADPDTFRIRIWSEDDWGVETVVYDNGMDQPIGGGQILIHANGAKNK